MASGNDSDIDQESTSAETPEENGLTLTRRTLGKGTAVLVGGGAGLGYLLLGSSPALAVEGADQWIANSAEITTQDGSIDSVTFGDPDEITDSEVLDADDNGIVVDWGGFDGGATEADFTIYIAGTGGGDGGNWTGGGETTAAEALATGAVTLNGTNGSETFTWNAVFGEPQPVNVAEHTEIELSDFEADTNDTSTVRELEVTIEVVVPAEDNLTATATTTATITVNNQGVAIEVGGEGSFEIESDEEVLG